MKQIGYDGPPGVKFRLWRCQIRVLEGAQEG